MGNINKVFSSDPEEGADGVSGAEVCTINLQRKMNRKRPKTNCRYEKDRI